MGGHRLTRNCLPPVGIARQKVIRHEVPGRQAAYPLRGADCVGGVKKKKGLGTFVLRPFEVGGYPLSHLV